MSTRGRHSVCVTGLRRRNAWEDTSAERSPSGSESGYEQPGGKGGQVLAWGTGGVWKGGSLFTADGVAPERCGACCPPSGARLGRREERSLTVNRRKRALLLNYLSRVASGLRQRCFQVPQR